MTLGKTGRRRRQPQGSAEAEASARTEISAPHRGREPPTRTEVPQGRDDEAESRLRLGPIEIRNAHRMTSKEVCKLLWVNLTLISAFAGAFIILFDNLLETLAAHSNQLAHLDPKLVVITIVGVFAFMGISVVTKAILNITQNRRSSDEEQSTKIKGELDELRIPQGWPGLPCSGPWPPALTRPSKVCRRITAKGALPPVTAAKVVMMSAAACRRSKAKMPDKTAARASPTTTTTTPPTLAHSTYISPVRTKVLAEKRLERPE